MGKPRRVETTPEPGYPSLEGYACERRGFLRKLFMGAVSLGVGSRVLAGCESTTDIDGSTTHPDLHTVRLPGEGFGSAYLGWEEYVRFAVTFTTYNEALAAYYRSHEPEGLSALILGLASYTCSDFTGTMRDVRRNMAVALEDHYLSIHDDDGPLVESLQMIVDTCEYSTPIGGAMEDPHYP